MAEPAKTSDNMTDFLGLQTNTDARSLPPGAAADQVNLTCVREGEMAVRPGFRVVRFDS